MLGAKLLDQAGLLSRYSSFPPHLPGLVYPLYGLERIDKLSLEGEYIHKSDNPFLFPHRVRLCNTRESTPKMTIGYHIWVHLPAITTRKLLENACSYVIDGWIVGVHFDEYGTTEFTVIGMFQRVLQVIFLSVPHAFVDRPRSPPFTMRHAGTCYWTYMSVPEVEARALNVQGIERGKIADWSPSYPVVQGHMRLLRCSSVFYFPLIDHQFFKPVSVVLYYPMQD